MREELMPIERSRLYFSGERVDRLPRGLLGIETGCSLYGIRTRECLQSVELGIIVQEKLMEEFGADSIGYGPDLKGIGEALGTEVIYPEWDICYVSLPVLKSYGQLEELRNIDFLRRGRLPQILEFLKYMKEKYGKTHEIDNAVAGPLSTAAAIRGTEAILRDMKKSPENLHGLLELAVEVNLEWIRHVWNECGAAVSIADPVASGSLLSVDRFREFAKPYLKKMCEGILKITGQEPSLHICGKTSRLWGDFPDIGISGFSLDNCESLERFKHSVGDAFAIGGNIDPTEVMRFGSPDDVTEALKECLRAGSDSPKGYIPGAGCQIPSGTPKENLRAFVDGVRKYTKDVKLGEKVIPD